jgi:hypothetical protein
MCPREPMLCVSKPSRTSTKPQSRMTATWNRLSGCRSILSLAVSARSTGQIWAWATVKRNSLSGTTPFCRMLADSDGPR